jgi:two-component system sensor histidine kinase ChvG
MVSAEQDHKNAVARPRNTDVVLGDDWIAPNIDIDSKLRKGRAKRGLRSLNRSPLARKIISFNLIALAILVAGILYLNPSRDTMVSQRGDALVNVSQLVTASVEAGLNGQNLASDAQAVIDDLALRGQHEVFVFGADGAMLAQAMPTNGAMAHPVQADEGKGTFISDLMDQVGSFILRSLGSEDFISKGRVSSGQLAGGVAQVALQGQIDVRAAEGADGGSLFAVGTPLTDNGQIVGALVVTTKDTAMDRMLAAEREQVLKLAIIVILVSVGLSLMLASLIANPLSDLADAAEVGRDRNRRGVAHNRIRIPDLTHRPDEIGRLSGALRGMVNALYERIESNEQFAADVAHEIKNPLASLRSAVGTLRVAKRDDQRERLLDVIDHDVRRLDRLVSDISNASRLDSELVKEEEESFDLNKMLQNLCDFLGQEAQSKGVDFITDIPGKPVMIRGLEARLAQVFVNLISNATSFCEQGDAIRLWCRVKESRVLIVVEDTGPGIPEQALTKIFKRFYSERPEGQFGNNSGLVLAISKQIVEAHGGVIWAENIRPADADISSEPLGARFVVGMPI